MSKLEKSSQKILATADEIEKEGNQQIADIFKRVGNIVSEADKDCKEFAKELSE